MGASSEGNHEGRNYMNLYEREVMLLGNQGMEIDRDYGSDKLHRRGFV